MIALVYAHPHPARSIANRALLDAVRALPSLRLRSLYELYPDFSVDVEAERSTLAAARLVIWQHPLYWYGAPALLKLWFETVLGEGWAYGDGGRALAGKDCLWVTTTGAPEDAYTPTGKHGHPFAAFVPPLQQTARFCGMNWLPPIVVHGAHRVGNDALASAGEHYRERLRPYLHGDR